MNRLLPNDRALKLFCMQPGLVIGDRSATPAIGVMTDEETETM